jgi:propionyl-CoA carboxylase alpha chain
LSENADFADACAHNNIKWLGPSRFALEQMGDKIQSKVVAQQAGVNCIPGYNQALESLEEALAICNSTVTYPVLLKAAAGGGGKGMRVCRSDQDLKEAWSMTKAEALQYFADDRLLVEKYVEKPHHIEFQVLCCGQEVAVFPERECSIQRRNQKVVEESPSTLLLEETRLEMARQTRQLCRAVE